MMVSETVYIFLSIWMFVYTTAVQIIQKFIGRVILCMVNILLG